MNLDNLKEIIFNSDNSVFLLVCAFLLFCFIAGFFLGSLVQKIKSINIIKREKNEALKKSRSILKGQIFEELSPIIPSFPVNPKELRFLGSPIDYVAFVANKDNDESIEEIVFIEVKTGTSNLSPIEVSIKEAIKKKKVRFVEYRLP